MSIEPVWAYRFTAENREHVVTFAEHPLHWEDAPIVLNTYRLDRFDAKDVGAVIADALNVHEATGLTPSQLLQKTGGSTATAPITRLDWLGEEGMKEFDDGEYVFYADHQQTVAQLQARVAELEAALAAEREAYAATCRTADAQLAKTREALSGMVEFFQPQAWGSEDNRAEALREAREVLGQ